MEPPTEVGLVDDVELAAGERLSQCDADLREIRGGAGEEDAERIAGDVGAHQERGNASPRAGI